MKLRQLFFGMATYIPGVYQLRARIKGTGGTDSARYCYSVWLRHLVMAKKNGLNTYPKVVAELGPGDSIGIGLAALISGCEKYFAFDVVKYANLDVNLSVFNEIVHLFRNRSPIPGDDEFPEINPKLEDYSFPYDIFDDNILSRALDEQRINKILDSLKNPGTENAVIEYKVPWYESSILEEESVDMIYSQAVLEHVNDLRNTYSAIYTWLKPDGYMSHTIDFRCHGFADEWNGHWVYSDTIWKLIRGNRSYLLNREPYSTHIKLIDEAGFSVVCGVKVKLKSSHTLEQLAPRFKSMPKEDLVTSAAFIQAIKKTCLKR